MVDTVDHRNHWVLCVVRTPRQITISLIYESRQRSNPIRLFMNDWAVLSVLGLLPTWRLFVVAPIVLRNAEVALTLNSEVRTVCCVRFVAPGSRAFGQGFAGTRRRLSLHLWRSFIGEA